MRRVLVYLSVLIIACGLVVLLVRPALAADGEVVVFTFDYMPVVVYENPSGCYSLPVGAHVLVNQTGEPVSLYGDPLCLLPSPGPTVGSDQGAHVPPTVGSFKVD
ncbi:MAG TPA: hypothetical protein VHH34_04695 [Pseudonocardiaceae bacterium]|nr:hypothetical protein [Pseudonocardiaceae bacterium]